MKMSDSLRFTIIISQLPSAIRPSCFSSVRSSLVVVTNRQSLALFDSSCAQRAVVKLSDLCTQLALCISVTLSCDVMATVSMPVRPSDVCRLVQKESNRTSRLHQSQIFTDFQNYFTEELSSKFAIRQSSKTTLHPQARRR